jgi:hypothetical protein
MYVKKRMSIPIKNNAPAIEISNPDITIYTRIVAKISYKKETNSHRYRPANPKKNIIYSLT